MYPIHELIILKVHFTAIINYSYLIIDPVYGEAAIIDPAWEMEKYLSTLSKYGVDLSAVFLTHSHYDHVNLVGALAKKFNPRVYMSRQEIDFYRFRCPNLTPFEDREIIPVGNTDITCLATPGHTLGGTCYYLPGALFTGDTIFTEGCGICFFPGGDPGRMYESIQMIKKVIPPETLVYPGHSYGKPPGNPLSYLFSHNIYFQFEDRENFINFRMRKNQTHLFRFK